MTQSDHDHLEFWTTALSKHVYGHFLLEWCVFEKEWKRSMQFEEPAQRLLQGKSNIQCNKWDQVRSSEHDLVLYFLTYLDDLDLDSKPFVHGAQRDCFLTIPRKCAAWAMLIRLG